MERKVYREAGHKSGWCCLNLESLGSGIWWGLGKARQGGRARARRGDWEEVSKTIEVRMRLSRSVLP